MRVERYGKRRYWAVRDRDGTLVACVYTKRGALRSCYGVCRHGKGKKHKVWVLLGYAGIPGFIST